MLKPLTLSLSLAVALGACSVSMAGLFGGGSGCSTCGMASPQSVMPTAQCAPSAQCGTPCGTSGCGGKKLFSCFNKPKCYSYEWVLKKKRIKSCGNKGMGCGSTGCETCASPAYPSSQGYASPQVYGSGQAYSSGQAYGGGASYGSGQAFGTGQAYGAGQSYGAPQATSASAPAPVGDEAPPAPEIAPAPPAPAAPAPPAPAANAPQSSLLFSSPAGN